VADTGQRAAHLAGQDPRYARTGEPTGWVGWVFFGGVLLILSGCFHAMSGLVALFKDDYYVVRPSGLVLEANYTAWGWGHLLIGLLLFAAGCGVMAGQLWARTVGVVLAVLSSIANMVFMAAYPVWSIIVITVDVIVIYALIVHGREAKAV
jgi:hypothetical protein